MIIISIHALLAESDGIGYIAVLNTDISIHALLAESDLQSRSPMILLQISIHALLAESDLCRAGYTKDDLAFLSTLSLRRATIFYQPKRALVTFLSTLSLRRATCRLEHVRVSN